eukprot:scaffold18524_cov14-Tisochrysis_lutea.AAC.1
MDDGCRTKWPALFSPTLGAVLPAWGCMEPSATDAHAREAQDITSLMDLHMQPKNVQQLGGALLPGVQRGHAQQSAEFQGGAGAQTLETCTFLLLLIASGPYYKFTCTVPVVIPQQGAYRCVVKCCEKFMNVTGRVGMRFSEFFSQMEAAAQQHMAEMLKQQEQQSKS